MKNVNKPFCTTLNISGEAASFFYSSHITPLHAHNTLQLILDLKNGFLFRTAHTQWQKFRALLIKDNVPHQLNTNNSLQFIIYIDAASVTAQRLINYFLKDSNFRAITIEFTPLEEALIHKNLLNPDKKTIGLITQLIFDRFNNLDIPATDSRINKVLCLIKDIPPAELSINDLASRVFISPSRLRMQFRKALGVSLHQYIIRQRIITAITHIINGLSIQQAAYNSGFNDSSHFNKLMRKIFHISPSMFLTSNKDFSVTRHNSRFNLKTELVSA